MESDEYYMALALKAAKEAALNEEVPVGGVLVGADGAVIATAANTTRAHHNPVGHAEINLLMQAGRKLQNHRLTGTSLYVTLEPCAMCAGAISHGRISRLVIAASDPKGGAVWHGPKFFEQKTCHWRPEIEQGPYAQEAGELLINFFRIRRSKKSD